MLHEVTRELYIYTRALILCTTYKEWPLLALSGRKKNNNRTSEIIIKSNETDADYYNYKYVNTPDNRIDSISRDWSM